MRALCLSCLTGLLLLGLSAVCLWAAPCAQCKAEMPANAKFCPQCGTKVQPATCGKCQAKLPVEAKFCPECGEGIGGAAAAGAPVGTPAAAQPALRTRAKQRYEGIFPVALYGSGYGPPGEADLESEAAHAWQKQFLESLKDLGFNTVAGIVPEGMIRLAEEMDMYVMTGGNNPKPLEKRDLTPEEAQAALERLDALCHAHKNVIAGFLYADPINPAWLPAWGVYGGVWNQLHPDVPLLATYANAAQWKQFDDAAPIGAAQAWVYRWKDNVTSEQALTPPVCVSPDCRDGRNVMPGLPIWPWVQGFGGGWGFRWPTTAEYRAAHSLMLVEGVRGAVHFMWGKRSTNSPEFLCNDENEPTQRLLELKPIIRSFAAMGKELLGYEVDDTRPVSAGPAAAASLYVSKTDPNQLCVMVASRDTEKPQKPTVRFDGRGEQGIAGLKDFTDSSVIPVRYEGNSIVADVDLQPGSGRLLAIVMQ